MTARSLGLASRRGLPRPLLWAVMVLLPLAAVGAALVHLPIREEPLRRAGAAGNPAA